MLALWIIRKTISFLLSLTLQKNLSSFLYIFKVNKIDCHVSSTICNILCAKVFTSQQTNYDFHFDCYKNRRQIFFKKSVHIEILSNLGMITLE